MVESGAPDRFGCGDEELAVACASHSGEPGHVETVTGMLARAGLGPDALRCGAHWPLNQAAAQAYGVGYAPNGWDHLTKHLRGKGFSPEELQTAGLVGLFAFAGNAWSQTTGSTSGSTAAGAAAADCSVARISQTAAMPGAATPTTSQTATPAPVPPTPPATRHLLVLPSCLIVWAAPGR